MNTLLPKEWLGSTEACTINGVEPISFSQFKEILMMSGLVEADALDHPEEFDAWKTHDRAKYAWTHLCIHFVHKYRNKLNPQTNEEPKSPKPPS